MVLYKMNDQRAFWLSQFDDEAPILDLPYDYIRPNHRSFKGKTITVNMPDETKNAINQLAKKTGSTDYVILLTSFMILLHKYSRQEDIVIGSPIYGRTDKDAEDMLVNTLAMRGYPKGNKSFNQLLGEIKTLSLNTFDNQEYPLEELIEEVVGERDLTRNPLFDVLFTLQNNDCSAEHKESSTTNVKFDLSMNIFENNGYKVSLEFVDKLFNQDTVERMLEHYLEILSHSVHNPGHKISEIEMITGEEKSLILNEFNNTQLPLHNEQTFVERFEQQVEKTPNQRAITYEGKSLSYSELNAKANQLAHQLRYEGVKPNSLVGIMTHRRLEMLIGIYGILKAGAAYVPIDPNHPSERINYIISDSQPTVLLTDQTIDASIVYEDMVIDITDQMMFETLPINNPPHVTDASDLMYVLYTSGTTGKPKGVIASYKGVMNRLNWMIQHYDVSGKDTILFKSPFTFDVSIWEIFGFAMVGAQATLLPSGEEGNPEKITSLIQTSEATMVHFVPSMLGVFTDFIKTANKASDIASINYVLASGEALKAEQANQFNTVIGGKNNTLLIDLYGPTEASEATNFDCENDVVYENIPIGKPIANTQVYILNEGINLMGIGVPGELCIGGVVVTKGYLNRPELTQEKFIDNPFGEGKVYRTGDLAKWHDNGNIAYLGRMDDQVKIRGYRIELGEIEKVLRQNEALVDVAVVAKPMVGEELTVCAYLVSDEQLTLEDIKTKLSEQLPNYMVPSYMIQIEKLPVTSNGKLDKKKLPEIKVGSTTYIEPSNEMESIVAEAFETILGSNRVSIRDNFFEVGGDSLKAIKVTSLLSKSYNISINDIFELKTIERISKVLFERVDTNIVTKLNSLKNINLEQNHRLNSDFINAINNYKEKSFGNYKDIDKSAVKSNKQILLTGATGYFGIHVLKNLLEDTDCTIYILVRNSEELSGESKLLNNWLYYFDSPLDSKYTSRIRFVEGNIELEYLGFAINDYNHLVKNVDIIINTAANVTHFATEASSDETNVNSIHKIVSFAKDIKKKEIHHMSTIDVASGEIKNEDSVLFSENDVDIGQKANNVYTNGKIKGEKLLIDYRNEGVETNIYRLGNLQCDSETGVFQKNEKNNAFYSVIKALKKLQKFSESDNDNLEFTAVNQAALACNKLILNDQLHNEIHHIYNNQLLSLKTLMSVYNENNHNIEGVERNEFIDYLIECIEKNEMSDEINDFLLHNGILDDTIFNKSHFEVLDYKTNFILEKLDFQWEANSKDMLEKMIAHPKNNY